LPFRAKAFNAKERGRFVTENLKRLAEQRWAESCCGEAEQPRNSVNGAKRFKFKKTFVLSSGYGQAAQGRGKIERLRKVPRELKAPYSPYGETYSPPLNSVLKDLNDSFGGSLEV
jgi:hypothetical protein